MKKTFYSNGKLLITGEYVVLDGAKALALPTKFGQDLVIEEGKNHEIHWTSYDHDGSFWFDDAFPFSVIEKKTLFENQPVKNRLITILHEAFLLNPDFLKQSEGYSIATHLTFPKFWGLGTSSTLINNIAQWLQIDAFTLLKNSFGGSGYDIACAQHNTPILYQLIDGKPETQPVVFSPDCRSDWYFVYLNHKQNSKTAIAAYYSKNPSSLTPILPIFDAITKAITDKTDYDTITSQLEKHELQMGEVLGLAPVKTRLFQDFNGTIKSLGAWGGDFVLAIARENPAAYFKGKGYETVVPYNEMILV